MTNQGDPAGFGGYQLHVRYDPFVFGEATITDLGVLDDGGIRQTTCDSWQVSPGDALIVCNTTGPFGQGAGWAGEQVIASVSLKLQPGVFYTVQGAGGGLQTTVFDDVRVTNTCGQPLNDGTIQPLPEQPECQGNLLPGIGASGTVLNPGMSVVTIRRQASSTPTATSTSAPTTTPSPTASPSPTYTGTPASSATSTPTASRTSTTVATRTPSASATPPRTASPSTTALATSTSVRGCPLTQGYWKTHQESWPVASLRLGNQEYSLSELAALLALPSHGDASVILAKQLIAAKLNIAAGADPSGAANLAQADALLAMYAGKLPYAVAPSAVNGSAMVSSAMELDDYNNTCDRAMADDSDGDAYSDAMERDFETSVYASCPIMRADVVTDGLVSILDVARIGASYMSSTFDPRLDQNGDRLINILDLVTAAGQLTKSIADCA